MTPNLPGRATHLVLALCIGGELIPITLHNRPVLVCGLTSTTARTTTDRKKVNCKNCRKRMQRLP